MGKGNALPPAARGAICDIDVRNARPIAQRVQKCPLVQRKVGRLDQGSTFGKDYSAIHLAVGQPYINYREEEWDRHQVVHRLSVGE